MKVLTYQSGLRLVGAAVAAVCCGAELPAQDPAVQGRFAAEQTKDQPVAVAAAGATAVASATGDYCLPDADARDQDALAAAAGGYVRVHTGAPRERVETGWTVQPGSGDVRVEGCYVVVTRPQLPPLGFAEVPAAPATDERQLASEETYIDIGRRNGSAPARCGYEVPLPASIGPEAEVGTAAKNRRPPSFATGR